VKPYYEQDGIVIYHGDCLPMLATIQAGVMVTDPPYGIGYESNWPGVLPRSIQGDVDTSVRDRALALWGERPALIFGTWRRQRPVGTRMVLVWDTKGALGMGDLSLPWKPSHQEIYVLGAGFHGRRGSDVLVYAPVQSKAANGRLHPHQKPVDLLVELIGKCPDGAALDPFMGSGSTLLAAYRSGRSAIGIEIEECYCEIAANRIEEARKQLPLEFSA
jgi:DNA modification methylase